MRSLIGIASEYSRQSDTVVRTSGLAASVVACLCLEASVCCSGPGVPVRWRAKPSNVASRELDYSVLAAPYTI
jgi:hypothetical protein